MSRFAFITEDPDYDNIFDEDDEGDWVDAMPVAEPFTIPKTLAEELNPYNTINS